MREKTKNAAMSFWVVILFLLWSLSPLGIGAAEAQPGGSPPIGQPLVREGDYALRLAYALRVATTENEIEAESRLGEIGITPAGGWIADYPVTPDVMAQLQSTVIAAADGGRLIVGRNDALKYMNDLNREFGLPVLAATAGPAVAAQPPAPVVINNYYASAGPPVVTYYAPPPDWGYLYTWVPYPFWWTGFHFSGYYILRDFDRVVVYRNRPVHITNHYWDRDRRAYRVHSPGPVYRVTPPHTSPRPVPYVSAPPRAAAPAPRVASPFPHVARQNPRVAAPSARAAAPVARAAAPNPRVAAPTPRFAAPNPRFASQPGQVRTVQHQSERNPQNRIERRNHDSRPDRDSGRGRDRT